MRAFLAGVVIGVCILLAKRKFIDDEKRVSEKIKLKSLETENDHLKSQISEFEKQVETLVENNQRHQDSQKVSDSEIDDLEDKLDVANRSLEEYKRKNEELLSKIRERENEIDSLKAEVRK